MFDYSHHVIQVCPQRYHAHGNSRSEYRFPVNLCIEFMDKSAENVLRQTGPPMFAAVTAGRAEMICGELSSVFIVIP